MKTPLWGLQFAVASFSENQVPEFRAKRGNAFGQLFACPGERGNPSPAANKNRQSGGFLIR
jgi:hypothetical protein